MRLEKQLSEIEALLEKGDLQSDAISKVGIYWHADHALRVIQSILKRLSQTDPKDFKKTINFNRMYIFALGRIPRGMGRAPKGVRPNDEVALAEIKERLNQVRNQLSTLSKISKHQYFEHPYFGHLKRDKGIKFLGIHTNHHLKIMRDIQSNH